MRWLTSCAARSRFDRFCVLLADPDTLMEHRGLGGNDWRSEVPTLNLNTGRQADVNSLAVLVGRRNPVGGLRAATGGDLARSERWREIYSRYGVGDELRTAAVDRHGCWGEVFMFAAAMTSRSIPTTAADERGLVDHRSYAASRAGRPHARRRSRAHRGRRAAAGRSSAPERFHPSRTRVVRGAESQSGHVLGRDPKRHMERGRSAAREPNRPCCPHLPPRVRMRARDGSWARRRGGTSGRRREPGSRSRCDRPPRPRCSGWSAARTR